MKILQFLVPINKKDWIYQIFYFFFFFLILLSIERLIFFIIYLPPSNSIENFYSEVIYAFISGIRYDMAILPLVFLIYHSILFFFYQLFCFKLLNENQYKIIAIGLFFIEWLYIIFLAISNFSSILNYEVNNKHLGWEYFAYFKDLPLFIKSLYSIDLDVIVSLFTLIFLWILLGIIIIFPLRNINLNQPVKTFNIIYFIFYLILNIILFRGGLQQNPLRPADALISNHVFINNLRLNGLFTIIHDASDSDDFRTYYSREENETFIKNFFKGHDDFVSDKYPLMRFMKPRDVNLSAFQSSVTSIYKPLKYNIIVIVLESWSAKFLKPYNPIASMQPLEIAPNFNQLSKEGILFQHAYASGGRSANGIFCILTGIPDRAGRTIFRSNQIFNRFGSLPNLLKEKGYKTIFTHSGDLNFDNLKSALPHLGFEILIGKEEMKQSKKYNKIWEMGYFDEDLYDISFNIIKNLTQPFFLMIFTSNNHHPFTVPDSRFEVIPNNDPEYRFKNSYYYSDYALGTFIQTLKKQQILKNTIVFIVADHTHHTNLNYYEDRQIPFLIYSPSLIRPKIRNDIVSQLDILPTILALTGGNVFYSSIGRDLTFDNVNYEPFAFFAGGSNTDIIGMIQFPYIYYHYFHSKEKYLFNIEKEINYNNMAHIHPDKAFSMDYITKHLYQISRQLEKENRLWPEHTVYQKLKKQWITD